ncbi:hypothetical protein [Limnohabitans sp. G3-2]|uniref:hypothetical protein n=1 Tax=Limnohabitans sp. G3-2 TaxID=1100711 RepID=UPI000CACF267|nr:hypothetical protein [Limnohabitans sp. G3-2]PIT76816.1 hypothetical protein B9Z31_02260 [Limnohabitans sp. G3-2]
MKTPWPAFRLWRITLSVGLTLAACACAHSPVPPSCPSGADLRADMLFGPWQVQLAGATSPLHLHLGPHPEHEGSLKGELRQGQQRHAVVADLDEGEFTLEESHDGVRIAATWLGRPTPGHCGRLIQGQRFEKDQTGQAFRLQRQP